MKTRINSLPLILILFIITSPELVEAQNFPYLGARSFGIAHSSSTLADEYAVFNNPGALGYVENNSVSAGYLSLYQVDGLSSVFATFSKSVKNGFVSAGVFSLGDEVYRQDKLAIGFGNKFGLASLGISINYHHYMIEGFGSGGFASLDIGGVAELSPKIYISGVIKNVTQTRISQYTGEYFPTLMSTGISFRPTDQLILYSQYDKDLENPGELKLGLEYTHSSLILRAGLLTNPANLFFGIGFHHKKLKMDYGMMNHQVLHSSHIITLSYIL